MFSRLAFGAFGINLVEYEAPPVLEQCYIPLRIATQGLMHFAGALGIATQGLVDLACTEAPVDAWRSILEQNLIFYRKIEVTLER